MALLQHHRLRLINDLQYERFIKDQHMIHMGELRRRQMRVSATEAETQNLVMANRSLKQRLDEAKRGEAQIKKEFDHRRNMTKKWESDLSAKLRTLREEQKKWNVEGGDLSQQLERAEAECEKLRRIVAEAEHKRLESEQNLEAVDISTAMVERLKAEIARLSASEREFQGKEAKLETAMQEAAATTARAQQTEVEVAAREEELHKAERHYEAQIEDLKSQLARAHQEMPRKPSGDVAASYEGALSAARAKNTALQKQYDTAMKKCMALESALLDVKCQAEQAAAAAARSERGSIADGDGESFASVRSPLGITSRQRGLSDPEAADSLTQSTVSPPPEGASTPLASGSRDALNPPTAQAGPSDGSGPGTATTTTTTSPHAERFFGSRG